jgi:hypothetical protein
MSKIMTPEFVANKWTMKRFRTANNPYGHSDREFYNLLLDDINNLLEQQPKEKEGWIPKVGDKALFTPYVETKVVTVLRPLGPSYFEIRDEGSACREGYGEAYGDQLSPLPSPTPDSSQDKKDL